MFIYLDIETIPSQDPATYEQLAKEIFPPANYSKPETIAKWEEETKPGLVQEALLKTSFDGALGQIVVASVAVNDGAPATFFAEDWAGSERYILESLFAEITEQTERNLSGGTTSRVKPVFVGHYVAGFDLRFIFQRAVLHGIRPPACIPFGAKPWSPEIYDTMTAWAGDKGRVSLDKLCRTLGIATKGSEIGEEMDGSKVWPFVQAGRISDVAKYCAGDVERVRQAHKKLTFSV